MAKAKKSANKKKDQAAVSSLLTRLNGWIERKSTLLFWLTFILSALFSFLLFNARISEGGDDSTYIQAGYNYAQGFFDYYFGFNAPLYPMFLALPIAIFGINLIVLKVISVIFHLAHIYFLFKVFDKRAPSVIIYPVLFATAINSFYLYFASQTYNEAFYVFLQAMVFFAFIKLQAALDEHGADLKKTYLHWLFMGLTVVLLALAKHIGITVIPALVVYFLLQKQVRFAIYSVVAFAAVKIPQELFKSVAWGAQTQYGQQGSMLLQVDPYDASKGQEDLSGFIDRFTGNAQLFLSKRFFQIIGFMEEQSREIYGLLTVVMIVLLLFGLYRIYLSKNRLMLFTALYIGASLAATFIVLQVRWDQPRYIMIYMPFILMIIFYGIYTVVKKSSVGQNVLLVCILMVVGSIFISTMKRSGDNSKALKRNLKGDIYYGYTPDWVNYLRMSEWVGDNLPDSSYVACRKAPMSFIYADGKKFYPIYRVQAKQADSVLTLFREREVTHVLLANLRRDPKKAYKGNIITTVHVMLNAVAQKYPERLKLVHQEGQIEPAYLYEIDTSEPKQ